MSRQHPARNHPYCYEVKHSTLDRHWTRLAVMTAEPMGDKDRKRHVKRYAATQGCDPALIQFALVDSFSGKHIKMWPTSC